MPLSPSVRDDEEIRCVPQSRLIEAAPTSRVLPFTPRAVAMSDAERLRIIQQHDPEGYAWIAGLIHRCYARRFHDDGTPR